MVVGGLFCRSGGLMYVGGVAAILLVLFAVLLMLGVVPMTSLVVGGLFLLVAVGFAGPFIVRTA
jgi:hypothetical protein